MAPLLVRPTHREIRGRRATQDHDRERIVRLLQDSRVFLSAAEVTAIIWPGSHHNRASYHLTALLREGRVKRLARDNRSWIGWKA